MKKKITIKNINHLQLGIHIGTCFLSVYLGDFILMILSSIYIITILYKDILYKKQKVEKDKYVKDLEMTVGFFINLNKNKKVIPFNSLN